VPKTAHIPIRRCVVCGVRSPQAALLRLARGAAGVTADPRRRMPGRGAYICAAGDCLQRLATKRGSEKRLAHALRLPADAVTRTEVETLVTRYLESQESVN